LKKKKKKKRTNLKEKNVRKKVILQALRHIFSLLFFLLNEKLRIAAAKRAWLTGIRRGS
jgi:hypothetical protein